MKLPKYVKWIALIFCFPTLVFAAEIFVADIEGVKVVLTDEQCQIKAVSNLPYRSTWTEKGVTYEGCWSPRPQEGVVLAYFSDLTVVAIPIPVFKKALSI